MTRLSTWQQLSHSGRVYLQQLVFPEGLTFDGAAFGTAKTSVIFDILGDRSPRDVDMVADTGFEPVTSTV